MNPIHPELFIGRTAILRAPVGMEDHVGGLAVKILETDHGPVKCFISLWVPSKAELEKLNAGACVQVSVFSTGQPPIAVGTSE